MPHWEDCCDSQCPGCFEDEDDGTLTAEEAVACVTKMLCFYEGQVWTAKMAAERARNIVTVWMTTPIRRAP